MFRFTVLLFAVLFFAASCRSPQKLTESGNYDEAIEICLRKLTGKSKKKTEYVKTLEDAFRKAQARDLRLSDRLVADNKSENWEKVNRLHQQIRIRQERIRPLIPLRSKDGYHAKFEFVHIDQLERDSREKAAQFLYDSAEDLLAQAEKGDRKAARQALATLIDLEQRYFRQFRDKEALKRRARDLGTSYILFEMRNNSNKVLPRDFETRILAIGKNDLDSEWKSFSFNRNANAIYDYETVFDLSNIDISPERISERQFVEEKEIQDGWEYVLDERGNVKKDSLGNDIKRAKMVKIRANIIEVYQTKAARITGSLAVFDGSRRNLIDSAPLGTEVLFENYASTYTGDARALTEQSRKRIGNRPLPFPPDGDMLIQAADRLKPQVKDLLRNNKVIF